MAGLTSRCRNRRPISSVRSIIGRTRPTRRISIGCSSDAEPDAKKKDIYRAARRGRGPARGDLGRAAARSTAATPEPFRPSARTRLLAVLGKMFGPGFLLPMLLAEEGREVKGYLDMHRRTSRGAPGADESLLLARESAEHATTLNAISGKTRRAVASHGVGRLSAQRRIRIQRRTDGELRSGRRRDRRVGDAAHHTVIVAGVAV